MAAFHAIFQFEVNYTFFYIINKDTDVKFFSTSHTVSTAKLLQAFAPVSMTENPVQKPSLSKEAWRKPNLRPPTRKLLDETEEKLMKTIKQLQSILTSKVLDIDKKRYELHWHENSGKCIVVLKQ